MEQSWILRTPVINLYMIEAIVYLYLDNCYLCWAIVLPCVVRCSNLLLCRCLVSVGPLSVMSQYCFHLYIFEHEYLSLYLFVIFVRLFVLPYLCQKISINNNENKFSLNNEIYCLTFCCIFSL